MPWTIYCHIHIESGRRYIGLTKKTMMQRWNQHVQNAKSKKGKGCAHFWNAIRQYGKDAFSHEVLEVCETLEASNLAEAKWIDHFNSRDPQFGFNLSPGGSHIPHPIKNPWDDPEYREKATAASRKTWSDPARRSRASVAHAGIKLSRNHCLRIAEARQGKVHSPDVLKKINIAVKETSRRPEIRLKRSVVTTALWEGESYRSRITSLSKRALKDPDVRNKISQQVKERWQDSTYRDKYTTSTTTHKICKKHGPVLLTDCYHDVQPNGSVYYACRQCSKEAMRRYRSGKVG